MGCCGFDKDGAVVIGIGGGVRFGQMDEPPQPDAYISYLQTPTIGMMLFVRTASSPMSLSDVVRGEIHALNKDRPIYDIKPMQQRIADSTARARFTAILLTTSAAIAIALPPLES